MTHIEVKKNKKNFEKLCWLNFSKCFCIINQLLFQTQSCCIFSDIKYSNCVMYMKKFVYYPYIVLK